MAAKKTILILSLIIFTIAFTLIVLMPSSVQAEPVGTAFTYQGRLVDSNYAANGLYDFKFRLYDDVSAGNQIGNELDKKSVDVTDGYSTVELDFGSSIFDGNERWLEIEVKTSMLSDPNAYALLKPRQKITPAPYAIHALSGTPGPKGDKGDTGPMGPQGLPGDSHWQLNDSNTYYNAGNVGIGTTNPTAKLDVNGIVKANAFAGDGSGLTNLPVSGIPSGVIVMWSGSIANIPSGWALCNGTNGTPDLRDRFIVGAGNSYSVGNTGGEASHTLTIAEMPAHTHSESGHFGYGCRPGDDGVGAMTNSTTGSTGENQPHENRPPYYALAYIMKL